MAKKMYIGVDNVARKVKKDYIGVDNKAQKIKKGYIGVGGVARPFFSDNPIEYYGTHSDGLLSNVYNLAAASVGNYALFAGGEQSANVYYGAVTSFNKSLTRGKPTALPSNNRRLSGTNFGNFALFGGGYIGSATNKVTVYNTTLTQTNPCTLTNNRAYLASASLDNCALFGGGYNNQGSVTYEDVDKITSDFTVVAATYGLTTKSQSLAAARAGNSVIFAGGKSSNTGGLLDNANSYDSSLTKRTLDRLSAARCDLAATTAEGKAIFTGGYINKTSVDMYDESLTHTIPCTLPIGTQQHAATTLGNFALFGGGCNNSDDSGINMVCSIDSSGTIQQHPNLNIGRYNLAAASVGNYALFAGGQDDENCYNTVDIYVTT